MYLGMMNVSTTERAARVDYVAEQLLSRAGVLVRLLVKQVRNRSFVRSEGEVLSILSEGPRRITELSELEGVAQPTMTALVKRLEGRGWVQREGVPDDGRVVMICLTGAGATARERYREQFLDAMRADLEALSDRQLAELARATKTLSAFVEDLQERASR
jgi:DNA-binding MarR family transcriptional regulator